MKFLTAIFIMSDMIVRVAHVHNVGYTLCCVHVWDSELGIGVCERVLMIGAYVSIYLKNVYNSTYTYFNNKSTVLNIVA